MSRIVPNSTVLWMRFPFWVVVLSLLVTLGGGNSEAAQDSQTLPSMGHQVGERILPFTLRLVDGSTVTSADLLRQSRPTFLMFFKVP